MTVTVKAVKRFSVLFVLYGVLNLSSLRGYEEYKILLSGLNPFIIRAMFYFSVFYAVSGVLFGLRMLRLENWARVSSVALVLASLVIGALMTSVVMRNMPAYYEHYAKSVNISFDQVVSSYRMFSIVFTILEMFLVYFFTRKDVAGLFK